VNKFEGKNESLLWLIDHFWIFVRAALELRGPIILLISNFARPPQIMKREEARRPSAFSVPIHSLYGAAVSFRARPQLICGHFSFSGEVNECACQ